MRFYQLSGHCQGWEPDRFGRTPEGRKAQKEAKRALSLLCDSFNLSLKGRAFFFPVSMAGEFIAGAVLLSEIDHDAAAERFLSVLGAEVSDFAAEEITMMQWSKLLRIADMNEYADEDALLKRLGFDGFFTEPALDFGENLLEPKSREELCRDADRFLVKRDLREELDRIYSGKNKKKALGHPVHYLVETDDPSTRREVCRTLLAALYANGRIRNRRYCFVDLTPHSVFIRRDYDCLCRSCEGGAILVRLAACGSRGDDPADGGRDLLEKLCESMRSCRDSVLTVFCLPRECREEKAVLLENLGSVTLVELSEDAATVEDAKGYLSGLCRKKGLRADGRLWAVLNGDGPYLAPELTEIFDAWYSEKLKRDVYPQYRNLTPAREKLREAAPENSAYDELMEMVGLTEAKAVIDRALAFHKAQNLFANKGMNDFSPSMHMVFTGNPGTAKTSVARLFARILRENGILPGGRLVEVGRGDLVGKYVGWTAPRIQKKFSEAEGGVLFIDEAYSLVDDRDGSFGDEAINTIVQEMENRRGRVIVIFAGYPDKMEKFLQKNPGLRSRIAWHVPFADYSPEELSSIAALTAKKMGLVLAEDAAEKLLRVFRAVSARPDFGNGRYARNLIEQARMAQAVRLLKPDCDLGNPEEFRTIRAVDIEFPAWEKPAEKPKIGFSAD